MDENQKDPTKDLVESTRSNLDRVRRLAEIVMRVEEQEERIGRAPQRVYHSLVEAASEG